MVKKIIITGVTSGIGEKILEYFLEKKYFVISISKSPLKKKINKNKIDHYRCDLTKPIQIDKIIKKITKKYRSIDYLINNAGASFQGYELSNFKKNLDINLIAPFYLSSKLKKYFTKDSCIINISSVCGSKATPNNPGYNSSKAGINMLTKSMALDFAPKIRVNSISLGYFNTKLNKKSYSNHNLRKTRANLSMLNKWGNIDEIPKLIDFLCSKNTSFITGSNIFLDGGWHAKGMDKI